jgi:DNA topoisomerase-1
MALLSDRRETPTSNSAASIAAHLEQNELFATEVGLRYVTDVQPGFRRKRAGKGFCYLDYQNNRVTQDAILDRIRKLVIPPAWDQVWICRHENGHLQATGRDQRVRKQYRYHEKWSKERNETKFGKLELFGETLPKIRSQLEKDLKLNDMSHDHVIAAVVRIMEETMIRVGNDLYAEENDSYGLTTIRNDHVSVKGSEAHFKFKGKSGVLHDTSFSDKRLSRIIKRCQDLPGQELFAYTTESGLVRDIESGDVNAYLKQISGESITAKDFRTWGATVRAASTLYELGPVPSETKVERKRRDLAAIRAASEYLGNTVAVCRKYYVHPAILAADESGLLRSVFKTARATTRLDRAEQAVLSILKKET